MNVTVDDGVRVVHFLEEWCGGHEDVNVYRGLLVFACESVFASPVNGPFLMILEQSSQLPILVGALSRYLPTVGFSVFPAGSLIFLN